MNEHEIMRAVTKVADLVPIGSSVTVEATPLYAGKPWDDTHEFGFNRILPLQIHALETRGCRPVHVAMIDDYTTDKTVPSGHFISKMAYRPERIRYESEFEKPAEDYLSQLRATRRVSSYKGELHLLSGSQPRLTVRSGRPSCELLDACMQIEKGQGTHIIFHPTEFVGQQKGMKEILCEIHGGKLLGNFITVFFKRSALSRILFTDIQGRTTNV